MYQAHYWPCACTHTHTCTHRHNQQAQHFPRALPDGSTLPLQLWLFMKHFDVLMSTLTSAGMSVMANDINTKTVKGPRSSIPMTAKLKWKHAPLWLLCCVPAEQYNAAGDNRWSLLNLFFFLTRTPKPTCESVWGRLRGVFKGRSCWLWTCRSTYWPYSLYSLKLFRWVILSK